MSATDVARFRFDAPVHDVQSLVLRSGAISAFTLGLYRFWMKTEIRRLFWGRTTLDGDPFEYDGTAVELVIGAALAAVLLVGGVIAVNVALSLVGIPVWRGGVTVVALAASAAILAPLMQFAAFRARRYRLRRTRWRGVRFAMTGSGVGFVWMWLGRFALTLATLGAAWPFLRVARERYMTERMIYGDARFRWACGADGRIQHGRFSGGGWRLMRPWLLVMLAGAIAVAGYVVLGAVLSRATLVMRAGPVAVNLSAAAYWLGLTCLVYFIFHAWCGYRAAELRLFMAARRVEDVVVDCRFRAGAQRRAFWAMAGRALGVGAILAVMLISFASLMLQLAVAADGGDPARFAFSLDPSNLARFETVGGRAVFIAAAWANYALTVLFLMWLWTVVYMRRLHMHLCETSTATGLGSLAAVRRRTTDDRLETEGFADALDVGGL